MKKATHLNKPGLGAKRCCAAVAFQRLAAIGGPLLTAGIACLLVSCASMDATTTEYAGARHFPPTDPSSVEILRSQPSRPHDRLGEVVIDASTEPAPAISDVEEKLRKEGARIGADAVVIVMDRVQPEGVYVTGGYWNRTAEMYSTHKLVGVAIKYRMTPTGMY